MSKHFSEHERSIIREHLVQACKDCWNRCGYQKTNIRELASMADISTGSFYQFYASKELLFVETAKTYEKELLDKFHTCMKKYPGKRGLAEAIQEISAAMAAMPWFMSMWAEWPLILRKLPPDFMDQDLMQGMNQMQDIIEMAGLKPLYPLEKVTPIIELLLYSIFQRQKITGYRSEAADYIIDCVVNSLFV